ncbi:MAG: RNase adapter RapZ [Clostridia bacterium]|nr:RNase adapter RapZ [Clostridia bacterium]
MKFVIVTGLSGAGKSQAVKILEDMDFFCVDNLPQALIPKFLEMCKKSEDKFEKVAIVMDIRAGMWFDKSFPALAMIEDAGYQYEILFLDASDNTLIKRFKTTRRRHPLAPNDRLNVGIQREREMLVNLKNRAKYVIDTSNMSVKQLREELLNIFEYGKSFEELFIGVTSFGFKNGIPTDVDLVFDARFLPNPYHVESLREFNGKDERIKDYVMSFPETEILIGKIMDYLEFVIPGYIKEGRTQLIIGIGCTGGKHRSVVISEEITKRLTEHGHRVQIAHRDIGKE